MGALAEALQRITVNATSADGTVKARMAADRKVVVEFGAEALRRHTDGSLAQAVEQAANGGIGGFAKATSVVYERRYGTPLDPSLPADASPVARRVRRISEEMSVTETSPRGHVKVGVGPKGRVQVRIRPGTLDRLDVTAEMLVAEINTTIAAARAAYSSRARDTVRAVQDEYRKRKGN